MKYLEPLKLYHELLKLKKTGPLLGLDVGLKYVNLSVSDAGKKLSFPLSPVDRTKTNIDLIASQLQSAISKCSISGLVIGYPFEREKRGRPMAGLQVHQFVDGLTETGKLEDMKYTFWEETRISKMAEYWLKPFELSRPDIMLLEERSSAMLILEGYLGFVNQNRDQAFPSCLGKET